MITIKFKLLRPTAKLPTLATPGSAGLDLYAPEGIRLRRHEPTLIPLGIASEIPPGYYAQLLTRSGHARKGIVVAGGVIDSDYRGEWVVVLHGSPNDHDGWIAPGERVAQAVIHMLPSLELIQVAELSESARGAGGFGSTGA